MLLLMAFAVGFAGAEEAKGFAWDFYWAEPTPFARPMEGRALSDGLFENYVEPRSGTRFRFDHEVKTKPNVKVILLDEVVGVVGTAFGSDDMLVVAFNSTELAADFLQDIRSAGQVFVTSTRHKGGGVFIAEVEVSSSKAWSKHDETTLPGVQFEYSKAGSF